VTRRRVMPLTGMHARWQRRASRRTDGRERRRLDVGVVDDKERDGGASWASPTRSEWAAPVAMVGIAFLFSRPEIEATVPAPPVRVAKNQPCGAGAIG